MIDEKEFRNNREQSQFHFLVSHLNTFLESYGELSDIEPADEEDMRIVADLYFRIIKPYKSVKLPEQHYTKFPKNAGVLIAAIMAVRPFRGNQSEELLFLNPTFALSAGMAKLGLDNVIRSEEIRRVLVWLDSLRFSDTSRIITSLKDARLVGAPFSHDDFIVNLDRDDFAKIGMIISYLEMWVRVGKSLED